MKQKIKHIYRKIRSIKYLAVCLAFILGAAVGGLGAKILNDEGEAPDTSRASVSDEDRVKDSARRLEDGYENAKADIAEGVKSGSLTKEQADAISSKLDEAYTFVKENPGTSAEERAAIRAKRQEWRDWAKENDVSSRYFIRIY